MESVWLSRKVNMEDYETLIDDVCEFIRKNNITRGDVKKLLNEIISSIEERVDEEAAFTPIHTSFPLKVYLDNPASDERQ